MRRVRAILTLLLLLGAVAPGAIEAPGPANVSFAELEQYRSGKVPEERWPALMETLGSDEQRSAVMGFVRELKPFPSARLVSLLKHQRLAVRLGALELLEDAAGQTFEFDPWSEPGAEGANQAAWQQWQVWAEKGEVKAASAGAQLTDETFRVLAQEITGGRPDRAEHALRRTDAYGLAAVGAIERFLAAHPELEGLPKAMLKQAEYRVVIAQTLPRQAPALARDLALGLPEIQSTALSGLSSGGLAVLPILAEFMDSTDPLVRESAVDAAFLAAGRHAVPLVLARMEEEKADSVLHAMLRGLGKNAANDDGPREVRTTGLKGLFNSLANANAKATGPDPILKLLEHPSENVVIAAIEALGFQKSGDPGEALKKAASDPRWRVRAAALETIGKRQLSTLIEAVKACLEDPEIFVRVTAVQAIARLQGTNSAILLEQFKKQHELKPAILAGLMSDARKAPPEEVWEHLQKAPPEIILQCLESFESRDDYEKRRSVHAARFAGHPNRDVSAAALRLLAGRGRPAKVLLDALHSPDPVVVDAVLDALLIAPGFFPQVPVAVTAPTSDGNPTLERLYAAMLATSPAQVGSGATTPASNGEADPAAFMERLRVFLREGSPHQKARAALALFPTSDRAACDSIAATLETLSAVDRRAVAAGLGTMGDWSTVMEVARRLLRDPADEVREDAIRAWLKDSARAADLLREMASAGSLIGPGDLYTWEFDRLLEGGGASGPLAEWSRAVLAEQGGRDANKVLAMVILDRIGQGRDPVVEPYAQHANPVLRRAAYRALGREFVEQRLDAVLKDDSALVRQVIPFLAAPTNRTWAHFFDDGTHVDDYRDYQESSSRPRFGAWAGGVSLGGEPSGALLAALEKLTRDPGESVRFEAMFALLRLGKPVDPRALAVAVVSQAPERDAQTRLGDFLEAEYARLGQGYSVLVPLAEGIMPDAQRKIDSHFKLEAKEPPTSFAMLARVDPVANAGDNRVAPALAPLPIEPAAAGPFRVLFFHKVGCRECERVREMLAQHARNFPEAQIQEKDIDVAEVALLNEALSARFQVKETFHQVTPAVFTQTGALVKDELSFPALGDLLRSAQAAPRDDAWDHVEKTEIVAAEEKIVERYDTLSLGVVGMAGLLDGVNPCAFATVIFLLSYLQVARRSPREILAVGAAFIGAVFLAYFLVGLGLIQVLGRLDGMRVVGNVLNYALAGLALVLALFSFRDAQLASRGQMAEMTLQLPGVLKEQIRTAIRTSSKARRFVVAAFVAGVVISLLELACTGQVYLPTILYMVRSGRGEAIGHLFAYNVAFVLPLVAVFGMAWAGMRSDALLKFQQRHVVLVKVLTGFLFVFLCGFLLFGHKVLPALAAGGN